MAEHIKIENIEPRIRYDVAATPQSEFTIPFAFFKAEDLRVYVGDQPLALTTDYTVTGTAGFESGFPGGTLNLVVPVTNTTVLIFRDIASERTTDFPNSGPFSIKALNTELDRIVAVAQQMRARLDRAIALADSDDETASLVLPPVAERAGKVLEFDTTGKPKTTVSPQILLDATQSALNAASATAADRAAVFGDRILTEQARDAAQQALADFLDRWYGTYPADPTQAPDGGPLVSGALYWNTTTNRILVYNGSIWQSVPVPNGIIRYQPFTATVDGQTVFSVSGGYEPGPFSFVTRNGVMQTPGVDVTMTSGADIIFPSGQILAGDEINFWSFGTFEVANVLVPADNLAGLVDKAVARTNLSVYSKTEVDALPFPWQCGRLVQVSSTTIRLKPYNGNRLLVGGVPRTIPSAGVDLVASGRTASTAYFIYAYVNGSTLTLEPSTTAPTDDPTYGIRVKTGDASRTLVGQAFATGAAAWAVNSTTTLGVVSWLNPLPYLLTNGVAGATTGSATFVNISGSLSQFLCWADRAVSYTLSGRAFNVTANGSVAAVGSLDNAAVGEWAQGVSATSSEVVPLSVSGGGSYSEGVIHTAGIWGAASGGTGNFTLKSNIQLWY